MKEQNFNSNTKKTNKTDEIPGYVMKAISVLSIILAEILRSQSSSMQQCIYWQTDTKVLEAPICYKMEVADFSKILVPIYQIIVPHPHINTYCC
ncbi:hypothetical protein B7P43_G05445 [Cryptotermes secundus]|uniref:Uncharacterized protein n=1 Tax=Cryptotermes secundus TaxID=105785 RepID=A0A2J7QI85_9NEOP|nr:hypothetical protein B7P43_G05445 [Cryptotermes secundus]